MKLIFAIAVLCMAISGNAQSKITFSAQNYVGLLEGEQGSKFQLQTINGMRNRTWFVGLGTGIDWYYRRSIPAFLSVNKDFFRRGNRNFFIATDAGINFPWRDDKNYNVWGYVVEKSIPGFFGEAGLGYKVGIGKTNDAVLIQLAYSYKHIREKVKNIYYYPGIMIVSPQPEVVTNRFDYYLRRLSLKLGWNF